MKKRADYLHLFIILSIILLYSMIFVQKTFAFDNEKAAKQANTYLKSLPFSRDGLIKQLKFDGYSQSEAEYAADNCGADWNQQAVKAASNYLNVMSFSHEKLITQLEFDGFTHEQAVFGANSIDMDETYQAINSAKNYISYMAFSKTGLIKQLEFDGY